MDRFIFRCFVLCLMAAFLLLGCALAETIAFPHSLPVVQLTVDAADLWDPETGLFAEGAAIDKSALPYANARYRETGSVAREGHLCILLPDGSVLLESDVQVSLYGQYEMDLPNKSFRVQPATGEPFRAALFPGSERTRFGSLLLRNASSDAADTHLRELLAAALLKESGAGVLHPEVRNAVLYLNGQYWGLYQIEEAFDAVWAAQALGTEQAALLNAGGSKVLLGSASAKQDYADLIRQVKLHPPCESAENLQYLLAHADAEAILRFMALWVYFGNSDTSTLRLARGADSRWQYAWQDSTWFLYNAAYDSLTSCTKEDGMGAMKIDNTIFRALLAVPEYRDIFLTELGGAYRLFTAERMLTEADALADEIRDEMMLHCVRWQAADLSAFAYGLPVNDAMGAWQYWQLRVERLRNSCRRRPAFMRSQAQSCFELTDAQMQIFFGDAPESWQEIIKDI